MTKPSWRDLVEAIGILSIVGSLIFVGYQIRQDQVIALAQVGQATIEYRRELHRVISENAAILVKSNSGQELTAEESLKLGLIASDFFLSAATEGSMRRSLGQAGVQPIAIFAMFLYDNPGIRDLWLDQSADMIQQMDRMRPSGQFWLSYRNEVIAELENLERPKN